MKRLHLVVIAILLALFTGLGWFLGQKYSSPMMEKMPEKMGKAIPSKPTDRKSTRLNSSHRR